MPIKYRIDHEKRIVVAAGYGTFADADVFGYQREVFSQEGVAAYDELIDMTHVGTIELPSVRRVQDLAFTAASMDPPGSSRFAVVAPTDLAYALGRMFQTYREADPRGSKKVGVFRTMAEALEFLGLKGPIALPDVESA